MWNIENVPPPCWQRKSDVDILGNYYPNGVRVRLGECTLTVYPGGSVSDQLTWLALGCDHVGSSRSAEQVTAL